MESMTAKPIDSQVSPVEEWPKVPQTDFVERNLQNNLLRQQKEENISTHISVAEEIEAKDIAIDVGEEIVSPQPTHWAPKRFATTEERLPIELPVSPSLIRDVMSRIKEIPTVEEVRPAAPEIEVGRAIKSAEPTTVQQSAGPETLIDEAPRPRDLVEPARTPPRVASKPLTPVQWTGTLSRFGLARNQLPNSHLSIGTKCNRLGGNECWKAIGPAKELFDLISKSIGKLLDDRVEELEEGEPVAGHILLFDLYMIGKSVSTAQPVLVVTCQRPKPRRRAIKFIKESGILKVHPKIALAESAVPPMVNERSHIKLLAGGITTFMRAAPRLYLVPSPTTLVYTTTSAALMTGTPVQSGVLSVGDFVAIFLGSFSVILSVIALCFTQRHHAHIKMRKSKPVSNPEIVDPEVLDQPIPQLQMPRNTNKPGNPVQSSSGTSFPNIQESPKMDVAEIGTISGPWHELHATHETDLRPQIPTISDNPGCEMQAACEIEMNPLKQSVRYHKNNPYTQDVRKFKIVQSNESGLSHGQYGMPIVCSSTNTRATIGGILGSSGEIYGLTVGHIFQNFANFMPEGNASFCQDEAEDLEFAFDDEEEAAHEIEMSDVAITSRGSISSAESFTDVTATVSRSNSNSSNKSALMSDIEFPAIETVFFHKIIPMPSGSSSQSSEIFGTMVSSSVKGTQLGLDWALIKLSESSVRKYRESLPKLSDYDRLFLPRRVVPCLVTGRAVTVALGYGGKQTGVLYPGFSMIKLSPLSKFQEVWTIMLDSKVLAKGDSGSWVTDTITGDLYGHIVAGVPGGNLAYVIPAFRVFQDISVEFGPVELATF